MYIKKKYKNAFFIELYCNDSNVKIINGDKIFLNIENIYQLYY